MSFTQQWVLFHMLHLGFRGDVRGLLGVEAEFAGFVAFAREVVVDGDGVGGGIGLVAFVVEEDEVDGGC